MNPTVRIPGRAAHDGPTSSPPLVASTIVGTPGLAFPELLVETVFVART